MVMIERKNNGRVRLVYVTTVPQSLAFIEGAVLHMQGHGFEVHAISSPGEQLERFGRETNAFVHGVPMTRRITPVRDLRALFALMLLFLRLRPVIVHASTPKAGMLGTLAAWLTGVPVRLYYLWGLPLVTAVGWRRRLLRATERLTCALAHRVGCVSRSLRNVILDEQLCDPGKLLLLGQGSSHGVDATERFTPDHADQVARQHARERFGIPPDALVIGFVGRVVKDKGVVELAAAWESLRVRYSSLYLLVVGPFEAEDPIPEAMAKVLRTDPRVRLPGWLDDPRGGYAAMDVVVLPSYREGLPNVPLEGAAMQLPVVTTSGPGCVDSVQDGVTGTVVPPHDAVGLAEAITRYLEDPELRRRHGRNGRLRVLRDFRPERIWSALFDEYDRLARERGVSLTPSMILIRPFGQRAASV
jgi:glycosyltransferase involved in cell wall biosynthesis